MSDTTKTIDPSSKFYVDADQVNPEIHPEIFKHWSIAMGAPDGNSMTVDDEETQSLTVVGSNGRTIKVNVLYGNAVALANSDFPNRVEETGVSLPRLSERILYWARVSPENIDK